MSMSKVEEISTSEDPTHRLKAAFIYFCKGNMVCMVRFCNANNALSPLVLIPCGNTCLLIASLVVDAGAIPEVDRGTVSGGRHAERHGQEGDSAESGDGGRLPGVGPPVGRVCAARFVVHAVARPPTCSKQRDLVLQILQGHKVRQRVESRKVDIRAHVFSLPGAKNLRGHLVRSQMQLQVRAR